ncbi:MAG TPA: C4-type zinc ribbon domain-containing protein [Opitutaceae bacterium]|nr:C4-type zinc ribbon domain-containing protein [Opitutaceae bacterium]
MLTLLEAQKSLLDHPVAPANRTVTDELRATVPAPVLAHFLRLVGQGRRGVVAVRHGVCTQCHIRVPAGMVAALANPADVVLCEHCGAYLVLPDEEMPKATAPAPVPARRARKQKQPLAA